MEKLLLFHLNDTDQKKVKQVARNLKIQYEFIDPAAYNQPLESLVSGKANPLFAPFPGEVPAESLLLMCDFSDKRMDALLLALRKAGVQIDYKAVLTPTNRKWNVLRLLLEMRAEKAAYENMQP